MRLHRFYIPSHNLFSLTEGARINIDTADNLKHKTDYKGLLHQWKDVFSYTAGSQVLFFDGKGGEVLAIIEEISWSHANLIVLEQQSKGRNTELSDDEPSGIWLFASIIKSDNFEWIIQKSTELGVDHIVPILSDRTVKKNINMERAKKIAIEASEQCGRTTVPEVYKPIAIDVALENFVKACGCLYVCAENGESILDILKKLDSKTLNWGKSSKALGFAIGPEGGWSEKEELFFDEHKFSRISLGKNVLRAETAVVAVMTLASNI